MVFTPWAMDREDPSVKRWRRPSGMRSARIQRIVKLLQSHDWFATIVQMTVVITGIVIGFQIDRWYEARRSAEALDSHLNAISADLVENRRRLEVALGYASRQIDAAIELRKQASREKPSLAAPELNALFSTMSGLPTFEVVDFAYRNLLSSPSADVLRNHDLKRELAGFFSAYELTRTIQGAQELHFAQVLQPYVIENLDYLAAGRPGSAGRDDRRALGTAGNPQLILAALHTQEFSNIVVAEWERAVDLRSNYEELLEAIDRIELALGSHDGDDQ